MELRRFLIILGVILVLMFTIVAWFYPANTDFLADNPFWNGTKDISSSYSIGMARSLAALPSEPQGVTIVLIPYLEYTPAELGEISNFVTTGGTLVLADDYGYGNQVLEYLGLGVRFSGHVLLDPICNYKSKWFPKISRLVPGPVTSNVDSLVLNHATCLDYVQDSDVLAVSSSFSFLDLNDNQVWDEEEPTGPLPVISYHNLGEGKVLLISDPSIFINSVKGLEDNHAFIDNIAAISTSGLIIDQSHLPPSNLLQVKNVLGSVRDFFGYPAGAVGLVIVALVVALRPIWHKRRIAKGKGDDIDY
jgi:hypothetical protein